MKKFIVVSITLSLLSPSFASAFSTAAWVAYWDKDKSTEVTGQYIDKFDVISPFAYEVDADGNLDDRMHLAGAPWTDLYAKLALSKKKTKIIPSILWTDRSAMHAVLGDPKRRADHIDAIMHLMNYGMFSGIDIDYENKKFETRAGYSAFLTELSKKLHAKKKTLVCTIEARTPPGNLFPDRKVHKPEYVNDFKVIGKVCDEVRLMTYDQRDADRLLMRQREKTGVYAAIGDPTWIESVVKLTAKEIPKEKIMIGIGTYGGIFKLGKDKDGHQTLQYMRAITYGDAIVKALENGRIIPIRDERTGERIFTYKKDGEEYICVFNDKESIRRKVALAKKLKVKGIVLFKVDAKTDQTAFEGLK